MRIAIGADHAEAAGRAGGGDEVVEDHGGHLVLTVGLLRLVADGVDAGVGPTVGRVEDERGSVDLGEVHRDGTGVFLGQPQAFLDLVHDVDLRGPAEAGGVGRHLPDRAGAVHRDGVAGADVGQLGCVVAGGEDVGEHREVVLVLLHLGQAQGVEVGEWHLEVLRLSPSPRPIDT